MNHKGYGIKARMKFVNLIICQSVSINPIYFCHINIPFQMNYNQAGLQDNHSIKGRNKKEPEAERGSSRKRMWGGFNSRLA